MRKLIALILILLLCGCAATAEGNIVDTPMPEEEKPEPPPAAESVPEEEAIRYTVSTTAWSDEACAEDGTVLAMYRFDLPELKAVREDGMPITEPQGEAEEQALSVTAAFNEKFGKWAKAEEFYEIVTWAEEDYNFHLAEEYEWYSPYTLELDCTVYQTEHMISVSGIYYSYTGGAHPNTWMLGWNYDLDTGEFFSPEVLGESAELQDAVTAEIIRQAQSPMEDGFVPVEMYWEDYEEIIANWPSYAVTFDEDGMDVVFSAYELAPYAAGPQEFHLSYAFLEPHLCDQGKLLLGLRDT